MNKPLLGFRSVCSSRKRIVLSVMAMIALTFCLRVVSFGQPSLRNPFIEAPTSEPSGEEVTPAPSDETPTVEPSGEDDAPTAVPDVGGDEPAAAPPEGTIYPYWEASTLPYGPMTGSFTYPADKTLVNTGSTLPCYVSAYDSDLRYTDATNYEYRSDNDVLTYAWTCSAGRFVDGAGVPTTPTTKDANWEARTATGAILPATAAVTITCTISDVNQSQNGESGNRHDTDLELTRVVSVGRISYSTPTIVPLNEGYDEGNVDESGAMTPDNHPHWNAAATPPALEDRIIATDPDPQTHTIFVRTGAAIAGTLSLNIPDKIRVFRTDVAGLPEISSGQSIAVANGSSFDLPIKIEGVLVSGVVGDVTLSAYFSPSAPYTTGGSGYGVNAGKTLTVAQIDMNISGNNYYPGSHGANEEMPGVFVPLNDDFDEGRVDANGVPIADNAGTDNIVPTDDELRDVTLTVLPAGLSGKWSVANTTSRVRVWHMVNGVGVLQTGQQSPLVLSLATPIAQLKFEAVTAGSGSGPNITAAFQINGTTINLRDKMRFNAVKLDLDVNRNGVTTDAVDRVANYLPGYEGDTRKVSTGTTFNAAQYVGQEMKVELNGAGSSLNSPVGGPTTGALSVDFSISSTTNYTTPGYCVNGFDAKVGWDGITTDFTKNDDFSFDLDTNDSAQLGLTQAGKATVPLWCKDYGGRCTIQADIKAGTQVVGTFSFSIPLDNDNDEIADRWEKEKAKEWKTQFGVDRQVTGSNLGFEPNTDDELVDPDGARTDAARLTFSKSVPNATLPLIPLTNDAVTMGPRTGTPITHAGEHAQAGDRRTAIQEYRGFILDGGGYDSTGAALFAGGHIRLSPAFKESLVAVDAMPKEVVGPPAIAGAKYMPDSAGIQSWMNTVSQNYSKRQDGNGCRMFYVLHNLSTPYDLFPTATDNPNYEVPIKDYLRDRVNPVLTPSYRPLTSFEHLQLADELGSKGTSGIAYQSPIETPGLGAIYAVDKGKEAFADYFLIAPDACAASYIAHELHHTIGNLAASHVSDTNGNTVVGEADDKDRLLWDFNFAYNTQGKMMPNGLAAGATELVLNNTDMLTSTGWVSINPIPGVLRSGTWVRYDSIEGQTLKGCVRINYNQNPPTLNPPQALPAFGNGTVVEPRFSAEDYKKNKYGAGTTSHISQFTP